MKLTLTNASIILLRTFIQVAGVAKSALEIYQDGELLCVTLPDPDLTWLMSPAKQAELSPEQLTAYEGLDKKFAETAVEVELTEKQRDRIKAVLSRVPELTPIKHNKWVFFLYKEFGFGDAK